MRQFCRYGARAAWASGILICLLGAITMVGDMSDPSKVGPAIAAALIPLVYALLLAEFFFMPIAAAAMQPESRTGEEGEQACNIPED